MDILDNSEQIKKLDTINVLGSIQAFPDQCHQAWEESSKISFPDEYRQVKNIIVCGMGGSRFTPKTIKQLYRDRIKIPYEIVEDYTLPGYVDSQSLVILSSYSGTTEEVISCAQDGLKKGAKLTGVAKGGKVAGLLQANNCPAYIFDPKFNPCGQPRIGSGYLLMGHLGLLSSLKFLLVDSAEVSQAISSCKQIGQNYTVDIPSSKNPAKQLALLLKDKHPFIITAEFLKGFGNGFANQINENAKMISDYRYISELNHHLMEGLQHPDTLHQNGLFVFITSNLYSPSIQKRFSITQEVVNKQQVATHVVELTGQTKLAQTLEAYTLSGFATFYLAILYGVDPSSIPWVDYFKQKLSQ